MAAQGADIEPEPDDVLDLGPRRESRFAGRWSGRGRGFRVAVWTGAVVVLGGLVATQVAGSGSSPRPVDPSSAPDTTRPPPSAGQVALTEVAALADRSTPLADFVRATSPAHSCASVAVGRSPVHDVTVTLAAALPGFSVSDEGRTLDQFTGLCSLQVRAVRADGTVAVLSIASPVPGSAPVRPRHLDGRLGTGRAETRFATVTSRTGWTVLAGVVGPTAGLPTQDDLRRLAAAPALTW